MFTKPPATKGVFMTTAQLPDGAEGEMEASGKKIILIDSINLAEYIVDYGIGVAELANSSVKRADSYFGVEL